MLEKWGAEVLFAEDGEVAVEVFQQQSSGIDAVLMDCEMPQMDGYSATRVIRASGDPGAHVPIIAVTAHALPEYRDQAFAAGMTDYVTKPLQQGVLLDALKTAMA